VEFDLFGWETAKYHAGPVDMPNDGTRVDYIAALIDRGFEDQILVSLDIDVKARCRKYGGEGRDHIVARIVPLMRRKGISQASVDRIMIGNPAQVLTIV
jgi:phosphotriesterase-related protein